MTYTPKHFKLIDKIIQSKLESLPRAIKGKAPKFKIKEIVEEIDLLKDIKDMLEEGNN